MQMCRTKWQETLAEDAKKGDMKETSEGHEKDGAKGGKGQKRWHLLYALRTDTGNRNRKERKRERVSEREKVSAIGICALKCEKVRAYGRQ